MNKLRLSQRANRDLSEIWKYIRRESGSEEPADKVIEAIWHTASLLSEHPFLGRRRDDDLGYDLRSIAVQSHVVIYRVQGQTIQIVRVVHGKRDIQSIFQP